MEEKVERDREGQRGGRKTEVEDIWRERERKREIVVKRYIIT